MLSMPECCLGVLAGLQGVHCSMRSTGSSVLHPVHKLCCILLAMPEGGPGVLAVLQPVG
jgi:hypothetical protein